MRKYALFGMTALAALSLAFAACGGDDDDEATDAPATTAATTAGGDQGQTGAQTGGTAATGPTASIGGTPSSGGGSGSATGTAGGGTLTGSGADALKKVFADFEKTTFLATYDIAIKDASGVEQKGTMTLAAKAPKTYTSFAFATGQAGEIVIIDDGTNSLFCTKIATAGQCMKTKSDTSGLFSSPLSLDELEKNFTGTTKVTQVADQNIGGQDSRCFEIDTQGTVCFSKKDNILTKTDGSSGGTKVTLVATKVTSSVDDKLFEAPAGYTVTSSP